MSRFDYRDPGTDAAYCDNISDEPEREMSRQVMCPNCNGAGTVLRETGVHGFLETEKCDECDGRGFIEEES